MLEGCRCLAPMVTSKKAGDVNLRLTRHAVHHAGVAPGSWPQAPTVKTLVGLAHFRVQLRERKRVDTAGMDFCSFRFIVAAKSIIRWQRSAVPKTAPARRPSNMTVQYASSCFVETAANDMLLWRAA